MKEEILAFCLRPLVLCMVSAIGFAGWPLLSRKSGAGNIWIVAVVIGLTALVCLAVDYRGFSVIPSWKGLLWLVAAGAVNGIGMLAFARLVSNATLDTSTYFATTQTLIVVITAFVGLVWLNEAFTWRKLVGLALACLAVWLIMGEK